MIPIAFVLVALKVADVLARWGLKKKAELERPTITASADDKTFTPGRTPDETENGND